MSVRARIARLARTPALHFVAIGALAFAFVEADRDDFASARVERPPITIGAEQVERLVAQHERSTGRALAAEDVRALVEREVEDEILYREACAHGLDRDRGVEWRMIEKMTFLSDHEAAGDSDLLARASGLGLAEGDPIVRRIVIEKMRLALRHAGSRDEPTEAELAEYLERERDRFLQPARVTISQLLLTPERHPGTLASDAAQLVAELRRDSVSPEQAAQRSDPVAFPPLAWSLDQEEIVARFGAGFAEQLERLEAGTWSDPIESPLGLHVVFVEERTPARLPALDAVRSRVLYGLLAERREGALRDGIERLRAAWDVRVEWPVRLASVEAPR